MARLFYLPRHTARGVARRRDEEPVRYVRPPRPQGPCPCHSDQTTQRSTQ